MCVGGAFKGFQIKKSLRCPPAHFMICGSICPSCIVSSHYCFLPMERWGAPAYSYTRDRASQVLRGLCFEDKNGVKRCTVLSDRTGRGQAAPRLTHWNLASPPPGPKARERVLQLAAVFGKSTEVPTRAKAHPGFAEPAAAGAMSAGWN